MGTGRHLRVSFRHPRAVLLAAGCGLSLMAAAAQAQTSVQWVSPTASGTTGQLWSTAANWAGGVAPVPGTTTSLLFTNLYTNLGVTSSNDLGNLSGVLTLSFNQRGTSTFTLNNASGGTSTITLLGGSRVSVLGGANSTSIAAGVRISAPVVLGGTGLTTIDGAGHGSLEFAGGISGGPGAGSVALVVNLTGRGSVQLGRTTANTFVGDVRVDSGQLVLLGTSAALGATGNTLIMNGGSLVLDAAAVTVNNPVRLDADTRVFGSASGTFNAPISGAGGLDFSVGTPANNTLTFTANNTFSGGFTLSANGQTPLPTTLSGNGAFSNASFVRLQGGQTLTLSNSGTASSARLGASTPIQLNRGTFVLGGNATTAVNQNAGALTLSGMGSVTINPTSSTGGATQLNVASVSRSDGGTLNLTGLNLGNAPGVGSANLFSAAAPTLVGGLLPWAIATNTFFSTSTNFTSVATYDATSGLRPLAAAEYVNPTYVNLGQSLGNARFLGTSTVPTLSGLNGTTSVNSLVLDTPSAATAGASVYGSGTLSVRSGALVTGLSSGSTASSTASVIGVGSLDFAGQEGVLHVVQPAVLASRVANTGGSGLTKGGNGTLTIVDRASTFTGPVTIGSGTVSIASDGALGDSANSLRLTGGLAGNDTAFSGANGTLLFQPSLQWGGAERRSLTISRSITLGAGGGSISASTVNGQLTLSGPISGSGALGIMGQVALSNINNSYSGPTVIAPGATAASGTPVAIITDARALGSGDVILSNGSLRVDGAGTTIARNVGVRVNSGSTGGNIITTGDVTLSGNVYTDASSDSANSITLASTNTLTKLGPGTLTLTADNAFRGRLSVTSPLPGATGIVGNLPTMTTPGTVVLSGASARLASSLGVQAGTGGTIRLDNTDAAVSNRLNAGVTNISGGALEIRGNATTDVAESLGVVQIGTGGSAGNASGLGIITLSLPSGATSSLQATASGFTQAVGANAVLIRGTNLGAAPGAGNTNFFIGQNPALNAGNSFVTNAPTVNNGVLRGVFYDGSATGNGTALAAVNGTNGVVAFTGATALPATGAVSTGNYDLASDLTLTGTTAANSLRINAAAPLTLSLGANNLNLATASTANTLMSVGAGAATISGTGNVALGTSGFVYNNNDLTINAPITASTNITKAGTGTLSLGNTTISGSVRLTIAQGTVAFQNTAAVPADLTINPGATADLSAMTQPSLSGFNGFGTLRLPASGMSVNGTSTNYFAGSMVGTGTLTVTTNNSSDGFGVMGSSPNFSGDVAVSASTNTSRLVVASNDAQALGTATTPVTLNLSGTGSAQLTLAQNVQTFGRNIAVTGAGTGTTSIGLQGFNAFNPEIAGTVSLGRAVGFTSTTAGSLTVSGPIVDAASGAPASGATAVNISTTANVNLRGVNTFGGNFAVTGTGNVSPIIGFSRDSVDSTGAVTTNAGNIASSPFGKGTITLSNTGASSVFTFRADDGARTIANGLSITSAGGNTVAFAGVNDLTITGPVSLGSGVRTFQTTSTGLTTLSGAITGSGASIAKSGGGTLRLTGSSSFSNNVNVSQGTFLASGTHTGAGLVQVSAGAILGGTGSWAGSLSVVASGILAPGEGPGTLTSGPATLTANNAVMNWELGAPGTLVAPGSDVFPAGSDLLLVNGSLSLPTGLNILTLLVSPLAGFDAGTYKLIDYGTGTLNGTVTANYNANFNILGLPAGYSATVDTLTRPGLVLLNVVPAPSGAGVLALAGLLAARRRRA